jgi:hypothetical protein
MRHHSIIRSHWPSVDGRIAWQPSTSVAGSTIQEIPNIVLRCGFIAREHHPGLSTVICRDGEAESDFLTSGKVSN